MRVNEFARPCQAGIAHVVEQRILQRTGSRIHRLRVELLGDRVVVHGTTSTYHFKQLALAGALEVLDSTPVEMDVQVGARSELPKRGYDRWELD